jgi:hypothetical protein
VDRNKEITATKTAKRLTIGTFEANAIRTAGRDRPDYRDVSQSLQDFEKCTTLPGIGELVKKV